MNFKSTHYYFEFKYDTSQVMNWANSELTSPCKDVSISKLQEQEWKIKPNCNILAAFYHFATKLDTYPDSESSIDHAISEPVGVTADLWHERVVPHDDVKDLYRRSRIREIITWELQKLIRGICTQRNIPVHYFYAYHFNKSCSWQPESFSMVCAT